MRYWSISRNFEFGLKLARVQPILSGGLVERGVCDSSASARINTFAKRYGVIRMLG